MLDGEALWQAVKWPLLYHSEAEGRLPKTL